MALPTALSNHKFGWYRVNGPSSMSDDLNARDLAVLSQVESSFDFDAASMSDATTNESHSDVASVDGDLSAVKIGSSAAGDVVAMTFS